jgi:hypothetical protein
MASLIFNPVLNAWAKGNVDFDSDTFKVMLVTSAYTPDKDLHDFRNDVTNEVVGTGYTAGGAAATVTVGAVDTANDREEITLGGASWPTSTITARGAVYYKSRGGLSSADEIIAYIDFGGDVSSSGGTFTLTASTLRIQN